MDSIINRDNYTEAQKAKGLNQTKLAEEIGKTPQQLSKYLNGDTDITARCLVDICKCLGCSADYLLGYSRHMTLKDDIKIAAKTTGLSEKAVMLLQKLNKADPHSRAKIDKLSESIDVLLSNSTGVALLAAIYAYLMSNFESVICIPRDGNELDYDEKRIYSGKECFVPVLKDDENNNWRHMFALSPHMLEYTIINYIDSNLRKLRDELRKAGEK